MWNDILSAAYEVSPASSWGAGESKTYDVRVTNTGTSTWNARGATRVRLGVNFGGKSDEPHTAWVTDQRFDLDKDLAPGTSQTVEVTVAAPADPGQYFLRHRMVKEGVLWFDESDAVSVAVAQTAHDESLARSPLFLATAAAVLGAAGAGLAFAARRRSRERGA